MASTGTAFPQTTDGASAADAKSRPDEGVTRALAHYLVTATYDDLPANARKEGVRTLLNWVGVAIGGSRHQTVEIAVAALRLSQARHRRRCLVAASDSTS
jgi:hypothetical protein